MDSSKCLAWIFVIAIILSLVGAINWGLIGLFNFDLVSWVNQYTFKNMKFNKIVYAIIGIAGLASLLFCRTYIGHLRTGVSL